MGIAQDAVKQLQALLDQGFFTNSLHSNNADTYSSPSSPLSLYLFVFGSRRAVKEDVRGRHFQSLCLF